MPAFGPSGLPAVDTRSRGRVNFFRSATPGPLTPFGTAGRRDKSGRHFPNRHFSCPLPAQILIETVTDHSPLCSQRMTRSCSGGFHVGSLDSPPLPPAVPNHSPGRPIHEGAGPELLPPRDRVAG